MAWIQSLLQFWLCHPALLYGIAFMLGIYCYLTASFELMIPCLFLWLPFILMAIYPQHREVIKPFILSLIIFFTAWAYAASHYTFPSFPSEGLTGQAHVSMRNISL